MSAISQRNARWGLKMQKGTRNLLLSIVGGIFAIIIATSFFWGKENAVQVTFTPRADFAGSRALAGAFTRQRKMSGPEIDVIEYLAMRHERMMQVRRHMRSELLTHIPENERRRDTTKLNPDDVMSSD